MKHNDVSVAMTVFKFISSSAHASVGPHVMIDSNGNKHDQGQAAEVIEDPNRMSCTSQTSNSRVVAVIAREANSTMTNPSPIRGYADEPLLPLIEACAPLAGTIQNLSFYVQIALNETPEQPSDGLTFDESAAIRLYTFEWENPRQSLYSMLNYTLLNDDRECLRPYFRYLKLFLTAVIKLPCVAPSTIWRGVTKDLSAQFSLGTTVTWWAFSSCTTTLPVLENNMYLGNTGARTLFSVEAINGRTIRAHSHFVTEDEILLLPGTRMIVQSQFSPAADLHVIHLKQVIPEEILLEPPFESNLNISYRSSSTTVFLYLDACLYSKTE